MFIIDTWLKNMRRLKVARRATELRMEIAKLDQMAIDCDKMALQCKNFVWDQQASAHRSNAAALRVKLGHNLQYEDIL